MAWDDDKKAEAVGLYKSAEPTPETSMEIVKDIAEQLEESPNGVRMILTKAGVYVKKAPAAKSSSSGDKPARVSKAEQIEKLTGALTDARVEVDSDIIEKMTGKAALYFFNVVSQITKDD